MDVALKNPLEAQYSVLGSLILEPRLMGEAVLRISEQDFSDDRCRLIFRTMRRLFSEGVTPDPVVLADKLPRDYADMLLRMMEVLPTASMIWEYAAIMREQTRLGHIRAVGIQLASEALDMETARGLIAELDGLNCDRSDIRRMDMSGALKTFARRQQEKPEYIGWGIAPINDRVYTEPGDYVVIGGYPSAGKTALALWLAYKQAEHRRVGFYSLETKDYKLADRLVTAAAQIDFGRVKRRAMTKDDYAAVSGISNAMQAHHLEFVEAAGMTVEEIRADALANRYEILYVDYLQIIHAAGRSSSDYERVTAVSMALQSLCRTTGITVVALSQLTRAEKQNGQETAPTMQSLRQSGQIEQDADVVMLLYKKAPKDPESPRILHVAKNKEGRTGLIELDFDGSTQSFRPAVSGTAKRMEKPSAKQPTTGQLGMSELGPDEEIPF